MIRPIGLAHVSLADSVSWPMDPFAARLPSTFPPATRQSIQGICSLNKCFRLLTASSFETLRGNVRRRCSPLSCICPFRRRFLLLTRHHMQASLPLRLAFEFASFFQSNARIASAPAARPRVSWSLQRICPSSVVFPMYSYLQRASASVAARPLICHSSMFPLGVAF